MENLPEKNPSQASVSKQDSTFGNLECADVACRSCGLPTWYQACYRERRTDGAKDRYSHTFGQLELAISERAKPSALHLGLAAIASDIDAHSRAEMSRVLQLDIYNLEAGFAREFIKTNTMLIRSVSFQQLDLVEDLMAQALPAQWDVRELAKQIEGSFDVTRARARLIARDQTLKGNSDLNQLRQRQGGVTEYYWVTSRDERVRGRPGGKWANSDGNHWVLDGTRQRWDAPPVVNPKRGDRAHPGQDYQCRCTATPIIPGFEGLEPEPSPDLPAP